MRKLTTIILLLCALVVGAQGAIDYTPIQQHWQSLPEEFVLATVGDSWTCNNQVDGETAGWGGDEVGSIASYKKNAIWADPTTTQGANWTARLGWRLGTHRFLSESVGGAALATNSTTFAYLEDSTICGWVDDAARFNPSIAIGYGGINNIISTTPPSHAEMRTQMLGFAKLMLDEFPHSCYIVIPTLQPCGLDVFRYKSAAQGAFAALTWTQIADLAVELDAIQDSLNSYIMDTLRADLSSAGYDSWRVFPYDHFEKLAEPVTWEAGAEAASYPLNLSEVTSEGAMDQADSVRYAQIRFVRTELENDSIHVNLKGLRQIADSMATTVFGLDLDTWTQTAPNKTIYVSKQRGNNWTNRLVSTTRNTPLATLQAAIYRAWPGDNIVVYGDGNQALLVDDSGTDVSVNAKEVVWTCPNLNVTIEDGAYYAGSYKASATVHSQTRTVGLGWFDNANSGLSDDHEPPVGLIPNYDTSTASAGDYYPTFDFEDTVIDGLKVTGYYYGVLIPMPQNLTFRDCEIIGGQYGSLTFRSYGNSSETLSVYLDSCTFWTDSAAVTGVSDPKGTLVFEANTNADSSRFTGWVKNCTFTGTSSYADNPFIEGLIDGVALVGNRFTDPNSVHYPIYVKRTATGANMQGDLVILHNNFDLAMSASTTLYLVSHAANRPDSSAHRVVFAGNDLEFGDMAYQAQLYYGPYAADSTHIEANVVDGTSYLVRYNAGASYLTLAQLVSAGAAVSGRNWPDPVSASSDTVRFGGRAVYNPGWGSTYGLSDYGIATGPIHASIGATQYTAAPWVSPVNHAYLDNNARIDSPWELIHGINAGYLWASDSLDVSTWYPLKIGTTPQEQAQYRLFIDAYNAWPVATRQKIRWDAE